MEVDEALQISIRRWAIKCAHKYKFAIPNKVIVGVLREFPQLGDERAELMEQIREICTEVNQLSDEQISQEIQQNSGETIIYE